MLRSREAWLRVHLHSHTLHVTAQCPVWQRSTALRHALCGIPSKSMWRVQKQLFPRCEQQTGRHRNQEHALGIRLAISGRLLHFVKPPKLLWWSSCCERGHCMYRCFTTPGLARCGSLASESVSSTILDAEKAYDVHACVCCIVSS